MNPLSNFEDWLSDGPWRLVQTIPDHSSPSSVEQLKVQDTVRVKFSFANKWKELGPGVPPIRTSHHVQFLENGIYKKSLHHTYACLDASRTWLVYWTSHALILLGQRTIIDKLSSRLVDFINRCQDQILGGYSGSPGQYPHLATSYAAVNALVDISSKEALDSINRPALEKFLRAMKRDDGSFAMHRDGESDVRGSYCALSVAILSGVYSQEMFQGTANWIISCQTYEGGFSGYPGGEAHGGYSFCAIAALFLLNSADDCDLDSLLRWALNRQHQSEGGFSGRTNKLVDACYSFWDGAVIHMIEVYQRNRYTAAFAPAKWLFNQKALQLYIMLACQDTGGGIVDKPGKHPDFYHTCYGLSGLSLSQNSPGDPVLIDPAEEPLEWISPYFNVSLNAYHFATEYNERELVARMESS